MALFHREIAEPKPIGNLIRCHDCKAFGYIAMSGGEIILPTGWRMAWRGLKPLYICGGCAGRRRKMILKGENDHGDQDFSQGQR